MVTCELDNEIAGEVMGWELPPWQALLFHRVLPSCGGFVVYLTLMCFDFALVFEHFENGDKGLGSFCLILMILPAVLTMVFTLASPPPGLGIEECSTVTCQKNDLKWIFMQILNCLFFPFAALGRYCHQIFWWIEAVCASCVQDEARTKEAVIIAHAHSSLELYLFLQAFIHAAPHAILNILALIVGSSFNRFDKVSIQAVSIIMSTLRMASTATLYRRFEREKICGRKYPWSLDENNDKGVNDNKPVIKTAEKVQNAPEEHIYETIGIKRSSITSHKPNIRPNTNSDLIKFSPTKEEELPSWPEYDSDADSGTSSDYIPDVPNADQTSNSDDDYVRPISIIDKVAPLRRDKQQYTIERVPITPPPVMPAPRPGSLALWAEKMVENAENLPSWFHAPPRHKYHDIEEEVLSEPDIPQRVPRSYIRGLEPQDATAALVQYLGWYAFFVSRLLAIAALINCVPIAAIIVLFSHYQITLLLLIVPQASTVRRGFYIFLAFIYLFCLMEFKIRFRHVRVWHVFWFVVCTVEAIVFTGLWYNLENQLGGWWKSFVTQVIMYSLLLSYMCFMVYFVLLKPRETIVYINKKDEAES